MKSSQSFMKLSKNDWIFRLIGSLFKGSEKINSRSLGVSSEKLTEKTNMERLYVNSISL